MKPAIDAAGKPDAPRVALVGCGKAKLPRRAQALHLYTGRMFRAAVDFALATHDEVFVLSALHELVDLEDELDPYNFTMKDHAPAVRDAWGVRVVAALEQRMGGVPCAVTVLAGDAYARHLRAPLRRPGWPIARYPLERVPGFGPRITWLQDALADAGGRPA